MELRKQIYFDTIKYICPPTHDINDITFKVSGILNVCLIEYRIMDEIEHVLNALLHVYNSDEIGLTIVCGSQNEDYIRDKFNIEVSNYLCARDFDSFEIGVIQCKTNWNDNAQIPMLWDMIYSNTTVSI